MKRGLVFGIFLSSLFLVGFASAQSSFSEFFSGIDPTLITLLVLFFLIFVLVNFSLSRVFKDNPAIALVAAGAIAILATYWINQAVSLANLLSGWGISTDMLYTFGPILFIALVVFFFVKVRFGVFVLLGGALLAASIANLVASPDILTIIGIVFVIIGLIGMLSKGGRVRTLKAKYNRIARRNPGDIRLTEIKYKINQLRPGFGQIK